MSKKVCKACLEEKKFEDFCKANWSKDGINHVCKKCIENKMSILKGVLKTCPLCEKSKDIASFYTNKPHCRKCIVSTAVQKSRIGEQFTLNSGEKVTIVEYFNKNNIIIKFNDGCILKNVTMESVVAGWLKNPMLPTICGIGYFGVGKYSSKNNKKIYNIWSLMIRRCYDEVNRHKFPTYLGCTVDECWYNFQVFAEWYENNYIEDFHLDKDILCKECKIYSPETCAFVPREINNFLKGSYKINGLPSGIVKTKGGKYKVNLCGNYLGLYTDIDQAWRIYREAKEKHINLIAKKWENLLPLTTYIALLNYKILK
jgi:hypothetical protein